MYIYIDTHKYMIHIYVDTHIYLAFWKTISPKIEAVKQKSQQICGLEHPQSYFLNSALN